MNLVDLISVFEPALNSQTASGAIEEMVQALLGRDHSAQRVESAVRMVIDREARASTGFGKGVAVPHAKVSWLDRAYLGCFVSRRGIEFNALDRQRVSSFICLLSPSERPEDHLDILRVVFSYLSCDVFRRFLCQASTAQEMQDLIREADTAGGV